MNTKVIDFAKEELTKYLSKLGVKAEIALGLFPDYNIEMELRNPKFDDAIVISVKDKKGYIAGSNERSVLIGVYRLLEEWGMGWVRPGCDNFPDFCDAHDVEISEPAYMRYRGIMMEGACSYENVLDMMDYIPKVGLNTFLMQYECGHVFYRKWYEHADNKYMESDARSDEEIELRTKDIIAELKKRGIILHRYGHGWTCRAYGVDDKVDWSKRDESELPEDYRNALAMLGGKRRMNRNSPVLSQLCYSKPEVRKKVVDELVRQAKLDPDCDVIEFWMADGYANSCECEDCRKGHYTDHYLTVVNEACEELRKVAPDKRIVFNSYNDNLYPPEYTRIKYPEMTIQEFAPITREYHDPLPSKFNDTTLPEYKTNVPELPLTADRNLAYLYHWKQIYKGDTFLVDYPLMWEHMLDAGGECMAKLLHDDIRSYEALSINGLLSCQVQRNAMPTAICMTVMAKTLWDKNADFDKIRRRLYADTFGKKHVERMCEYFSFLSKTFDIGIMKDNVEWNKTEVLANFEKSIELMAKMKEYAKAHKNCENSCHSDSWEYLIHHAEIYTLLAKGIILRITKNEEEYEKYRDAAVDYAWKNEEAIQPVLDVFTFKFVTRVRIIIGKEKSKAK